MKLDDKSDNSLACCGGNIIDFLHHVSMPHCLLDKHQTDLELDRISLTGPI